ncbi:MAG: hypothetical protein V1720_01265 [bacterium]
MPEEFVQNALRFARECGYDLQENYVVLDSLRALKRENTIPLKLTLFTLEYFKFVYGSSPIIEGVK